MEGDYCQYKWWLLEKGCHQDKNEVERLQLVKTDIGSIGLFL